jgi:hypothetical protein
MPIEVTLTNGIGYFMEGVNLDEEILGHFLPGNTTSMFAIFIRGLRGTAHQAILELTTNLQEASSHARTYHMLGDNLAPVR